MDIRNSPEYNQWKNEVKSRDGKACRRCGFENNLHVHHIKPFKKYPEFATELDNGLTLCGNCHSLLKGEEESTDLRTFLGDDKNINKQLQAIDGNFSNYLQRKLESGRQHLRDSAASALFSHLKVYPNSLSDMLPLLIYIVDSKKWGNESSTKRQAIGWLERVQTPETKQVINRHEQRIEQQRIEQQHIAEQERLKRENEKREAEQRRQQEIIAEYGSLEAYGAHQSRQEKYANFRFQIGCIGGPLLIFGSGFLVMVSKNDSLGIIGLLGMILLFVFGLKDFKRD